ncbi:heat shock 70 kDa protein 14 [Drosophila grimshawi]|uniref:GH16414 n=1 Tax=Drosophila grimshawi TaxID=7222 RepID=B4IZF5_DROGR|nr:heat shock 70 kDa protein 14 [Drosophila grimshawi]EDV96710.1 GH16414 [Drosophila grimshawi]
MWPRFGIKIGNSTLCIAYVRADGKAEVIANKQGDRVSQACLLWNGDSETECGLTAKQKMATRPKQAVAHSFQLLQSKSEITEDKLTSALKEVPCEYDKESFVFRMEHTKPADREDQDDIVVTKEMSAFQVTVELLRAELELARQYHTASDQAPMAVLSIPSYYPPQSVKLLSDAAKDAGFQVAQIIAEHTAAVLCYKIAEEQLEQSLDRQHVLTIKCGGLYSDFVLYAVENGYLIELAKYGPFPIGGKQFTEALVQFICEEFKRKYKLDPHESRRSLAKIRTAAANCKHILTTLPSTQLYIDSLMDGVDFNAQMSRARFESLIQPVINGLIQQLSECLERAQQAHPELKVIDHIVLLGATMQIPKLQSALAARYPDAKLHNSHSTDEVVAIGCARQAVFLLDPLHSQLQKADDCVLVEDDLYIWHGNDDSNAKLVLSKGSILPAKIKVSLPQSGQADASDAALASFKLRTGQSEIMAHLPDTTPTIDDGLFQLEVEVDWDDKDGNIVPLVRLRCM